METARYYNKSVNIQPDLFSRTLHVITLHQADKAQC